MATDQERENQAWTLALYKQDPAGARAIFASLQDNAPDSADCAAGMILCALLLSDKAAALEQLDRRARFGDVGLVAWHASWIAGRAGAVGALSKIIETASGTLLEAGAWFGLGHIGLVTGDFDKADEFFARSRKAAAPFRTQFVEQGSATSKSAFYMLDNFEPLEDAAPSPDLLAPVAWFKRVEPEGRPVVFTSANPPYIRAFLSDQFSGMKSLADQVVFHVNISDPNAEAVAEVETLLTQAGAAHAITGLSAAQPESHNPAMHASARFLLLPELMEQYQSPIVTLDIDMMVKEPGFVLRAAALPDIDFAAYLRPTETLGGYVYAAATCSYPTEAFVRYMRTVRALILQRLASGSDTLWFVDQVALFHAWRLLERSDAVAPRLGDLNQRLGPFDTFFDHIGDHVTKRR